jgi:hypothetical protein
MKAVSVILVSVLSTSALSGCSATTVKYMKNPTEHLEGYIKFNPADSPILLARAQEDPNSGATKLDAANPGDVEILTEMNKQIGVAESAGDRDWLAGVIAPELAFFRANKIIDDAGRFLQKVVKSDPRPTSIESVEVIGNRAIVKCVVTMKSAAGESLNYHNLRLFIRYEGKWRLLGWANEEVH